jgi:hypothetical protein
VGTEVVVDPAAQRGVGVEPDERVFGGLAARHRGPPGQDPAALSDRDEGAVAEDFHGEPAVARLVVDDDPEAGLPVGEGVRAPGRGGRQRVGAVLGVPAPVARPLRDRRGPLPGTAVLPPGQHVAAVHGA